ncbi:hypothetical protein MKX03_006449 [Papaver bracteatum]|nr:hypothetical protein MKX03_006449 [Papaver bracteatum]
MYRAHTCHVSTYSSPKVLKWVCKLLSTAEQEIFLSTAIGPLLHLPMQTWSSALCHFLLASQISTGDEGDKGNREEMRIMDEVCDDIMWHKEDAKHLVMLGLCEGPLVDDEEEDSLKNENVVENEDMFEKGEEEKESKNVFVDEQVPEESNMDDEEDEEDLLGNDNVVEEEDLVAPPSSQPDALCSRTSTSIIASFESFVKNAMIGHTEDLKITMIGEMEMFKSAVKGQLEELSVQCLTAEIKSINDKIGGTHMYNALSKTKTMNFDGVGTPPGGHNEEGDFDGAAMQKPDMTPDNGSNSIELNPPYPYNHPNKEVDVSRPVVSICCISSVVATLERISFVLYSENYRGMTF